MIYVVGHNLDASGERWEFIGAFTRKDLAIAACLTPQHWIGVGTLDVATHGPPTPFPISWFPLTEEEPAE